MSHVSDKIKESLDKLRAKLTRLLADTEVVRQKIKATQMVCSHPAVTSWTNNDGNGQFRVNRCEVCGLQKDGPLK